MRACLISAGLVAGIAATIAWQAQDWRWSAKVAAIKQGHAVSVQTAEAEARKKENTMQAQAERITDEADKNQTKLAVRAVFAERAVGRLRDEIARLNARQPPGTPEAAAYAGEASAARELLGACSDRYRAMAQDADRIRDQVTGLQDYVKSVCLQVILPKLSQ